MNNITLEVNYEEFLRDSKKGCYTLTDRRTTVNKELFFNHNTKPIKDYETLSLTLLLINQNIGLQYKNMPKIFVQVY